MPEISIESAPNRHGWDVEVEVDPGSDHASRHNVRVLHDDITRWGGGGEGEAAAQALVRRTFEFLLAKEDAHEILKSFELADVTRYYPDFPEHLENRPAGT